MTEQEIKVGTLIKQRFGPYEVTAEVVEVNERGAVSANTGGVARFLPGRGGTVCVMTTPVPFPGLRGPAPRAYPAPPAGHPVTRWPLDAIRVEVRGGGLASPEVDSVRAWTVEAELRPDAFLAALSGGTFADELAARAAFEADRAVASMSIYAVVPGEDILEDLDQLSGDLLDLGRPIWTNPTEDELDDPDFEDEGVFDVFAAITGTDWEDPVLLVDRFEVAPRWRGTALTPALAAWMLAPFAELGARAAALVAHPYLDGDDPGPRDVRAVQQKIAGMWAHLGFAPFTEHGHLAARLDGEVLRGVVEGAASGALVSGPAATIG